MSRRKIILLGLFVAVACGGAALWISDAFWPFGPAELRRPKLVETPPLKASTQTSIVSVPVAVALSAISASLDAKTPRKFTGKRENPIETPFGKTDVNWNIGRGALAVFGRPEGLTLSTTLSGTLHITDQAKGRKAEATGSVGNEFDRWIKDLIADAIDQRGDVRGNARLTVRAALMPNWRVDTKISGQISIPEGGLKIAGTPIEITGDMKSAIDRTVREQLGAMETQLRNNEQIEQVARRQWEKLCRSIALPPIGVDAPNLWLELRPMRVFASQPAIDTSTISMTIGIEAQTRIVSASTKPECPFPAQLDIMSPVEQGRFSVVTPIEVPFAEVNRLLDQQLKGQTFPKSADAPGHITVLRARVAPSGNRLLVSLLVRAQEDKSWFGFGAKATVFILARPQLDPKTQTLRLTDIVLDVKSRAAFGLLGAAARASIPYFQESLNENAIIDLKPYAASARAGVEALIAEADKQDDGLSAEAAITGLRLVGIEFDSSTLRMLAEVEGTAKVALSKLPEQ